MRLEIHMQPLCPALARHRDRPRDQPERNALPTMGGVDAGIEDKGMHPAIPGDIDEADQLCPRIGADMGKAARQQRLETAWPLAIPGHAPQRFATPSSSGNGSVTISIKLASLMLPT